MTKKFLRGKKGAADTSRDDEIRTRGFFFASFSCPIRINTPLNRIEYCQRAALPVATLPYSI